jgi:hypothetical protein
MNRKAKQILATRDTKKEIHKSLDQLFENCYIDALTGRVHCKKCNKVVHIDLSRKYVFCSVHGMLI